MSKITSADIADAAQAYRMKSLTSDQLQALIDEHASIPCVSSEAIALAAKSHLSNYFFTAHYR